MVAVAIGVLNPRHGWADTKVLFDCAECCRETVYDIASDDSDDERMPALKEMTITCQECRTAAL